uniref:Uncharacterized protein n=1 Tax=Parascaris univalens TaxID=6257 RepID=A0A915AQB3_PARUN
MGTVSAIVIVCVLLISAAITLILILVTVPSELDQSVELPPTFQVEERSVDEKADRIAIAQNGQIITINAEQISLFDSTKRRFQAQIPFRGKAIAVNGSEAGQIEEKIGKNRGTFSLGITFDEHLRLIAVVRGQPLLRIFQDGKLIRNIAWSEKSSVIWSEVLYEGARLHVVDYLANTLNTFHYPSDLIK